MDLKKFGTKAKANAGVRIEIMAPDGKPFTDDDGNPSPVFITVRGADSDVAMKQGRRSTQKLVNQMVALGTKAGKVSTDNVDAGELFEQRDEDLAELVVGWENVSESGAALECTPENVLHVFYEYPFIRAQVRAAVNERSNFLAG